MRVPRASVFAISLLSLLALASCYEFPMDPAPQADLDVSLIGTWRCLPPDETHPDTEPGNFIVTALSARMYGIRAESKDEEPLEMEAYFSVIGGQRILNVRFLDPSDNASPWVFVRPSFLLPNVLRLQIVRQEILESAEHSPAGYRRALEAIGAGQEGFYEYMICVGTNASTSAEDHDAPKHPQEPISRLSRHAPRGD